MVGANALLSPATGRFNRGPVLPSTAKLERDVLKTFASAACVRLLLSTGAAAQTFDAAVELPSSVAN
jgi:hypothetical protein